MRPITSLMIFATALLAASQAPTVAEKSAPPTVTIATQQEPGERIIVSGIVFESDGKTPIANASVYVYHTDSTGHYTQGVKDDNKNPRLRGYMRTDAQGRYEYNTIKPAPYPGNGPPAHIHYHVNAPGHQERIFEIVFEGDPKITDDIRARASREDGEFSVRSLTRNPAGGWRCMQDVTLRR